MRINIYGEEITNRIEIVKKAVNQETFIGVRFYLKSHQDLHHSESDNDESAVTFWCPWKRSTGNQTIFVAEIMKRASELLFSEK